MKRFLLLFCCAALTQMLLADPIIKFERTCISFGTFKESKPQTCTFVFTNTGDEPLVIHQAYASCGCTVPSAPKEPIAPGEKGTISVTYNGKGKFPGHFRKAITVRANTSPTVTRLYIEGQMELDDKQ